MINKVLLRQINLFKVVIWCLGSELGQIKFPFITNKDKFRKNTRIFLSKYDIKCLICGKYLIECANGLWARGVRVEGRADGMPLDAFFVMHELCQLYSPKY